MRYLKNAWYVAALSSEVGPEDLFHRKLLGTNVLLYRKQNGDPIAMRDRCPTTPPWITALPPALAIPICT